LNLGFADEVDVEGVDVVGYNFADEEDEFFLLEGVLGGGEAAVLEKCFLSEESDLLSLEINSLGVVDCIDGDPVGVAGDALICVG
jgi:hypothetical protein